jgi:hypothetical protein
MAAALNELEAHGIRNVEITRGAKHPLLRFQVNGGPVRVFAVPGSPGDWRSPENTKRDLRVLLRDLGVIAPPAPKPAPPPRKLDRWQILERRIAALELALTKIRANGQPEENSP